MNTGSFISSRLGFKGKTAVISTAVSFLVIIISVTVARGFRSEIRDAVSFFCSDVQLTPLSPDIYGEDAPVSSDNTWLEVVQGIEGVREITPVIYRAGLVKEKGIIQGVLFKAVPSSDSVSLSVRIPQRLADMLSLGKGDRMTAYFIGERVKTRRFTITDIYPDTVELEGGKMVIYASLPDFQRLNLWTEDQVSAFEIKLDPSLRRDASMRYMAARIGSEVYASGSDYSLRSTASIDRYPQLFEWLTLIDFNVLAIILLMSVVAGFNMISGLLIILFRNISTIGILKTLGMTTKGICSVFLKGACRIALKGMAVGNALALLFCLVQDRTHLIKLNPSNYFVSFVPVKVDAVQIIFVDVLSFCLIMLLTLLPCIFISRVDPSKTVKVR